MRGLIWKLSTETWSLVLVKRSEIKKPSNCPKKTFVSYSAPKSTVDNWNKNWTDHKVYLFPLMNHSLSTQFISIFVRSLFQITKYSTCAQTERRWNWRWRFNDSWWSNWNLLSHSGRILEPSRSYPRIQAKLKTIKLCENIFLNSK